MYDIIIKYTKIKTILRVFFIFYELNNLYFLQLFLDKMIYSDLR